MFNDQRPDIELIIKANNIEKHNENEAKLNITKTEVI